MNQNNYKLLILVIILLLTPWCIKAQSDFRGAWNLREKDSLLEHASKGEYYKGIIWSYSTAMHELIPQDNGSFHYIRTSPIKKTTCQYDRIDPEGLVIQIFKDFARHNVTAENCNKTDLNIFQQYNIIGTQEDKVVVHLQGVDDNYKQSSQLYYLNLNLKNSPFQNGSFVYDSLIPIAIINKAVLIELTKTKKIILNNGEEIIPIDDLSSEQIARNENFGFDILVNDHHFFINLKNNEQGNIIKLDANSGEIETLMEEGFATGIYKNYLYCLTQHGLVNINLNNNEMNIIIDEQVVKFTLLKENVIPSQGNFIWGNEFISIADIDMLQSLNLEKLFQLRKRISEIRDQLEEAGISEYDYPAESSDFGAPAKNLDELPENQQQLKIEIRDLKEKRNAEQDKIKQRKNDAISEGKIKYGLMPEEYKLMLHPITQEPIFISNYPEWPVFTLQDLLIIPPEAQR